LPVGAGGDVERGAAEVSLGVDHGDVVAEGVLRLDVQLGIKSEMRNERI